MTMITSLIHLYLELIWRCLFWQLKRYKSMQEERKSQGKAFVEAPPPDSIRVWKKQM